MAQYTAQKTVTDQTLISLSQLDAKYQQVALSALNLSEAERQEINTKLQGLATGSLVTGQQMQELLMDTNLDAATKKRILAETGLTNAIGVNTIAEKAHVLSQLEVLLKNKAITKAEYDAIVAKMADVTATNTMTGANMGLAASFKTLMASIPVWGWIALAISAVISVLQTVIPMIKSSSEQFEEAAQALADIRSERESLNDELKTTEERIAELEKKGTLSFTDSAELQRLRQENAELERKLILLDKQEEKEEKKQRKSFNKKIGKDRKESDSKNNYSVYDGYQKLSTVEYLKELGRARDELEATGERYIYNGDYVYYDINEIQTYIDAFGEKVIDYQDYLDKLYENGFDYSTADEETKKNVDFANEMIDAYMVVIGKTDALWSQIYNRDKYAEARTEIEKLAESGNLTAESLQNLYNQGGNVKEFVDYMLSLETVDWKTMLGDKFTDVAGEDSIVSLDEALKAMSDDTELASKIMDLFANELNEAEDAAKNAESSFKSIAKTLSDGLDKLSNKKDILSDVKEQLNSFGAISADNISKILEQFADDDGVQQAVAYYLSGIGTAQQVYDAMAKGYQNDLELQAKNLAARMQNDEKYYEAIGGRNQSFIDWMKTNCYDVDLSNATSLADAKLKIENQLIGTLKTNWQNYYNAQGASIEELVARARAHMLNTSRGREAYDGEHEEATKRYNEIYALYKQYKDASDALDQLTLKGFNSSGFNSALSTDFDKDSGKTPAEKYFDELKYKLETNQITQEQYLKDLDAGYKRFYNKTAEYLEDYSKYSQEVYEGFKDMYKEDLEAQKEAWEEKKDAVSEYYDNLREQIENAHDEEDYEKEQSEKRKEIFDLDMQIAELMRDGSEKAKARIAELEEERLKAEEELLDFETDKAREDELSRLEKEQKAEEDKIQDQIDKIDGDLKSIDENITKARQDIINYAKAKGVILDFAHASGTRSSPGGFGRINEKGIEMISAPDGNGNYIPMLPNSYVFSAKATEFLWKLATEHSLPQAMYNSIAKSIKTQSSTPSVNIAQPITITMGDVIIKGNADKQTVADIKKQQENTVRMVLQKIKELQK